MSVRLATGKRGGGKGSGNPGKPGKRLQLTDLQSQFGVGLKEAAIRLGICPTTLKVHLASCTAMEVGLASRDAGIRASRGGDLNKPWTHDRECIAFPMQAVLSWDADPVGLAPCTRFHSRRLCCLAGRHVCPSPSHALF